jgi:hypothetical protein
VTAKPFGYIFFVRASDALRLYFFAPKRPCFSYVLAMGKEKFLGLADKIMLRIERRERRLLIAKTAGFGALLAGSVSLIGYGWMAVVADASHSGFFAFTSLFFSDFSAAVSTSFSDLLMSLVESFPVFSTVLFLSGIFFAIWSAARFINDIALIRQRALLTA